MKIAYPMDFRRRVIGALGEYPSLVMDLDEGEPLDSHFKNVSIGDPLQRDLVLAAWGHYCRLNSRL